MTSASPESPTNVSPDALIGSEVPETSPTGRDVARSDPAATADASKLLLELGAVADIEGLEREIVVLRASIRQLADGTAKVEQLKVLAELRHQIMTLCHVLKAQQALAARDSDRTAEMAQLLDELDDTLEVPR